MSRVLKDIIDVTGQERPSNPQFVRSEYIEAPTRIECSVAVDDADDILGFQSLIWSYPGNRFDVPQGWAIIGTHIGPSAHRRGVGKALFEASKDAAARAGVENIDAFIGEDNEAGLNYYHAMGFREYRRPKGVIQKVYRL